MELLHLRACSITSWDRACITISYGFFRWGILSPRVAAVIATLSRGNGAMKLNKRNVLRSRCLRLAFDFSRRSQLCIFFRLPKLKCIVGSCTENLNVMIACGCSTHAYKLKAMLFPNINSNFLQKNGSETWILVANVVRKPAILNDVL